MLRQSLRGRSLLPASFALAILLGLAGGGALWATSLPVDLSGKPVDPLNLKGSKAGVLIFVRSDCPVSNRYVPEISRLYHKFSPQGVAFWMVFVDPRESPQTIRQHIKDYSVQVPVLRDPSHVLVQKTGVQITPEVAVFEPHGSGAQMVYRGRIDNWYVDFGKSRVAPTVHDLENTLDSILAGKTPALRTTQAVGCYISDLP
jgi:AhpC/TSA family